jgi:acetylglutamate kinase
MFGADRLLFLTDVDGVRGTGGTVVEALDRQQARRLIADGVATGGMLAKLNAADAALSAGVGEVRIAPGAAAGVVARLLAGESLGTRVLS